MRARLFESLMEYHAWLKKEGRWVRVRSIAFQDGRVTVMYDDGR